jgi:hypothetical protein
MKIHKKITNSAGESSMFGFDIPLWHWRCYQWLWKLFIANPDNLIDPNRERCYYQDGKKIIL